MAHPRSRLKCYNILATQETIPLPKNKRNLAPLPMRPIGIALFIILSLLLSALPVFAESTRGQLPERPDIVTALETTAPTLLSSEVLTSGDVISLDFDKDLHTDSAKLPPVTAFILLANQTEVRIGSVGLSQTDPRRSGYTCCVGCSGLIRDNNFCRSRH